MWDKGSIWPGNIATPEPNTGRVCGMGTLGIWPDSLNTEEDRLVDKRLIHPDKVTRSQTQQIL